MSGRHGATNRMRQRQKRPAKPDTVRVVLLLSIVLVMLFALYTLFLWPTIEPVLHQKGDHAIENEQRELDSLRIGGGSLRREDNIPVRKNAVQHLKNHIENHASGVAAEYNVPSFPVTSGPIDYPLRAPQKGIIVYGRPGTVWEKGNPTRGLVDVDAKHLHGQNNLREDGSLAWTPLPDLDWSKETLEEKKKRHEHTCFNVRHSDSIPLDRDILDARNFACPRGDDFDLSKLPTTSVVFVFYNEPISPLLRSLHSVLNRSPPELLKEIILIDDGSTAEWCGEELESYIRLMPKTVLKRIKRSGLMVARTEGALIATADTVTFLDSHIEVNQGWLEPLMARIAEDKHHVVMPIIDSIGADNLKYRRGGIDLLGFTWTLGQSPITRPRSPTEPMESPIMAGGLFSIDRLSFYELGTYDQDMRLYGGEEMEISFRIWQCGYTLECLPCSHVGHIFRSGEFWSGQVFNIAGHEITRNKIRAARTWMGEDYATIVELASATLPEDNPVGDLSAMLEIKNRLQCKDFDWYLHNVFPEQTIPTSHPIAHGALYNPDLFGCVDSLSQNQRGSPIGTYPCHWNHGTQALIYTEVRQLAIASTSFKMCVSRDPSDPNSVDFVMQRCEVNKDQQFEHDLSTGHLKLGSQCVEIERATGERAKISPFRMFLTQCSFSEPRQEWRFKE